MVWCAGGAQKKGASVLAGVKALAEAEGQLEVHRTALQAAEASLKGLEAARRAHEKWGGPSCIDAAILKLMSKLLTSQMTLTWP